MDEEELEQRIDDAYWCLCSAETDEQRRKAWIAMHTEINKRSPEQVRAMEIKKGLVK